MRKSLEARKEVSEKKSLKYRGTLTGFLLMFRQCSNSSCTSSGVASFKEENITSKYFSVNCCPVVMAFLGGSLENLKVEQGRCGNDVVEQVALDLLVTCPVFFFAESIHLQWDTELCGLELAYHTGHVLVNVRIGFDIGQDISAEYTEVGLLASVDDVGGVDSVGLVVFLDVFLFFFDVFLDSFNLLESFDHLRCAELDAFAVDGDAAHDTSAFAFRHSSPVGELVGDH